MNGTQALPAERRHGVRLPAASLALFSILSLQLGASLVRGLFGTVGAGGAVFLRTVFAAVILLLLVRPTLRQQSARGLLIAALFGVAIAGLNLTFYAALERLPQGITVTLEFAGPLTVAIIGSRRRLDLLWAALAAAGIILLTPWPGSGVNAVGVSFALLAALFWAAYILLSARVGRAFSGRNGLALSLLVSTVVLLPAAFTAGPVMLRPRILLIGFGVSVLSSLLPFTLELEVLRRIPARTFGILMSLEPAVATAVGFAVLRQSVSTLALLAIVLVTAASIGASATARITRDSVPAAAAPGP